MTDSLAADLEALAEKASAAPWAWGFASSKDNGYIVGAGCTVDDKPVSGFVDMDDITDEFLCKSVIGEHEASTCNYKDPELIVLLRNNAALLCAALRLAGAVDALEKDGLLDVKSPMEYEDLDNALSSFRSLTEAPRRGA